MWTYVTDDRAERDEKLAMMATMLNRPPEALAPQILIGPADECAAKLRAYAGRRRQRGLPLAPRVGAGAARALHDDCRPRHGLLTTKSSGFIFPFAPMGEG